MMMISLDASLMMMISLDAFLDDDLPSARMTMLLLQYKERCSSPSRMFEM